MVRSRRSRMRRCYRTNIDAILSSAVVESFLLLYPSLCGRRARTTSSVQATVSAPMSVSKSAFSPRRMVVIAQISYYSVWCARAGDLADVAIHRTGLDYDTATPSRSYNPLHGISQQYKHNPASRCQDSGCTYRSSLPRPQRTLPLPFSLSLALSLCSLVTSLFPPRQDPKMQTSPSV